MTEYVYIVEKTKLDERQCEKTMGIPKIFSTKREVLDFLGPSSLFNFPKPAFKFPSANSEFKYSFYEWPQQSRGRYKISIAELIPPVQLPVMIENFTEDPAPLSRRRKNKTRKNRHL